ncbi:SDR family oxidoreductase [Baekduia alba]|uniref:SDR family oxidoreductase n=1 Tax=Baekduia alba TaxID=2997333 RepID=UPI00233FF15C|nr:SDR family oxidoreductase [Baekduia alba]
MTSPVLVTGGTGTLGRLVVPKLRDAGCDVRVLSRRRHDPQPGVTYVTGDLLKGDGIDAAVDRAGTILHLAGGPKGDDEATRNLVRAATRFGGGPSNLVHISVIGANRVPLGYFKAKLGAEQAIRDSGLPFTILRAAQFHDFVLMVAEKMTKLPVLPVPSAIRWQPVDADEVATRLVHLTLDAPAGAVPDLAGPEVHGMGDLIRSYVRARGKHRAILPIGLPGKAGRAYKAGENLAYDQTIGHRTWEDFLAARVSA